MNQLYIELKMINGVEDLNFVKLLGKGSFGEVYLTTKRGRREYFATKKMSRSQMDQPSFKKYFDNEIGILRSLNHPNIVKIEDLKVTKNHYFLVMEYVNGGSLTDCLENYKKMYGQAFPEGIVQYLMKQIVDAIKYIHSRKIIHRDLKLDNIMVNFYSDKDKNDLIMMRAEIKIIDFGFATRLNNQLQTFSVVGSPYNMDPLILKRYSGDINKLGYDSKADIWSLGTICYEMLIGERAFNADSLGDLIEKIESGNYKVPTSLSQEVVSFLNGMLQYESEYRLNIEELSRHPFLTKKVSEFKRMNLNKASKNLSSSGLSINTRHNKSIWSIFNEEDEKKLINIQGSRSTPEIGGLFGQNSFPRNRTMPEMKYNNYQSQLNNNNMRNYQQPSIYQNLSSTNISTSGMSFYGQNMHPNNIPNNGRMNQMSTPQMGANSQRDLYNSSNYSFGVPRSYSFSSQIYNNSQPNISSPYSNYQPRPVQNQQNRINQYSQPNTSSPYSNYQPNPVQKQQNRINQYAPYNNDDDEKKDSGCLII